MRTTALVLLLISLTIGVSGQAAAQHGADLSAGDSAAWRNDCRLAAQVLRGGHPAPQREWAQWTIRLCPGAGSTITDAALALRESRDTATLNAATAAAIEVRDAAIYEAALSILGDRTASPESRVCEPAVVRQASVCLMIQRPNPLVRTLGLEDVQ